MDTRVKVKFLPVGCILDRYLALGFIRVFLITMLCSTALYLIVDFFDQIGTIIDSGAPISIITRYFFYKAPLSISRVIGFATMFSGLFCLGMLARTQEITAMRASGINVQRIALPLVIVSLCICLINFFWNETLVPIFAHRAQTIYRTEVKNKKQQSLFGTTDIWIRGENSFINVNNFDTNTNILEGVTIFLLNRDFSLSGLLEIPRIQWTGRRWEAKQVVEWKLLSDGRMIRQTAATIPAISETPEDLKLLVRKSDEFTFFDLQKQISDMRSKGLDPTSYEVDLQVKLAFPMIPLLMVLIAVPFALKWQRSGSLALSFGAAMLIGFAYWVVAAFCISLGRSGALPTSIAAWVPNFIFAMIGLYFFTAEE